VRVRSDNAAPDDLTAVLAAGWHLEQRTAADLPTITADEGPKRTILRRTQQGKNPGLRSAGTE